MNTSAILSTALLFFMLMDPFGNLPVFAVSLRKLSGGRYIRVVLRESLIALAAMTAALFAGKYVMLWLRINKDTLGIAGGLILLLIALKMIFSTFTVKPNDELEEEPFIVPLAIPLICGPGLIAMLVTIRGAGLSFQVCIASLLLAWLAQMLILLCGKKIASVLGQKPLDAMESLMGLLLACISVGMIVEGINSIYHIGGTAP